MLKKSLVLIIFIVLICNLSAIDKHGISYDLGGGRFGDKVLGYSQARYLSYLTSIQFLYRPFYFTDQLIIDYAAIPYEDHYFRFSRQFHINSRESLIQFFRELRDLATPSTLYILDYFPSDISEWTRNRDGDLLTLLFNFPWRDRAFSDYLQCCLKPRIQIPDFTKKERLNVAVHVRTLCGEDGIGSLTNFPLKHPTCDYHKRQIRKVYEYNLGRPTHVFLFSDTKVPLELVDDFRRAFDGCDIVFDIQVLEQPDLNYTVQDFFAMQQFDVLIATQSNFSMMAARFGQFDMVIFPLNVRGEYPNYYIDRVQVLSWKSDWFPYELDMVLKD